MIYRAPLLYINTALGDDTLYFRRNNKIMMEFRDQVYESAMSLNNFYRWLREGKIVKKKTATVKMNGKRRQDLEKLLTIPPA